MRVPRTRGLLSGLLLVLLGAWGALIAFIGPYFHFAFTPDNTWTYTSGRLWLEVLPGAGAFLGGLIVLGSAHRARASIGGWLAAASGAWFVVGLPLSTLSGMPHVGTPTGGTTRQALETLSFFYALGAVIVFLAALALGRFAVVGVRETQAAERDAAEERVSTVDETSYYDHEPVGAAGTTATHTTADPTVAEPTVAAPAAAASNQETVVTRGPAPTRGADQYGDQNPNPNPSPKAEPERDRLGTYDEAWAQNDAGLPPAPPVGDATVTDDDSAGLLHRFRHRHAAHASGPHDGTTS
ncbi:MAG TPA: hypothetical protein VHX59_26780 [Mycobacteriales bacterium]|jgi:hypothetical protein|nr:hypothetical protein [Mycobacteriales bacterium]